MLKIFKHTHTHRDTRAHTPQGILTPSQVWETSINAINHLNFIHAFSMSTQLSTSASISLTPRNSLLPAKIHFACATLPYAGGHLSPWGTFADPRAMPGLGRFPFHMTAHQICGAASIATQANIPRPQLFLMGYRVGSPGQMPHKNTWNLTPFDD